MRISASVYSNPERDLSALVADLDLFGVDYFHIDCNDDPTVFDDIAAIRKLSSTPIDLHIISPEPSRYFDLIRSHEVELVSFQYEALAEPLQIPEDIDSRFGLALQISTDLDAFAEFADQFSFVMFMTTTPGKSGGKFDEHCFERIRIFHERWPGKQVHVDGGVNEEVSFILRSLGVNCAISGSYLVKNDQIGRAMLHLKSSLRGTEYRLADFMLKPYESPIVYRRELNLERLLEVITAYRMGFAIIVDEQMHLEGLVSDADVRQALSDSIDDLNRVKDLHFINRTPVCVSSESSVQDLMEMIHNSLRPLNYLPVVQGDNRVVGVVSFKSLIKGEL